MSVSLYERPSGMNLCTGVVGTSYGEFATLYEGANSQLVPNFRVVNGLCDDKQ